MITLTCPTCSTSYRIGAEKSGKRTKCAKCNELLLVPKLPVVEPTPSSAPSADVGQAPDAQSASAADLEAWRGAETPKLTSVPPIVFAFIPLGIIFIYVAFLLVGPTDKKGVENRLVRHLPPHETVDSVSYDPVTKHLMFQVKCQNYGDPLGATFEVSYHPNDSIDRANVSYITVTRYDLAQGGRIKLVEYTFKNGKITNRKVIGAQLHEGAWLENTATLLDSAARNTL